MCTRDLHSPIINYKLIFTSIHPYLTQIHPWLMWDQHILWHVQLTCHIKIFVDVNSETVLNNIYQILIMYSPIHKNDSILTLTYFDDQFTCDISKPAIRWLYINLKTWKHDTWKKLVTNINWKSISELVKKKKILTSALETLIKDTIYSIII
jgi:hypothetical protein